MVIIFVNTAGGSNLTQFKWWGLYQGLLNGASIINLRVGPRRWPDGMDPVWGRSCHQIMSRVGGGAEPLLQLDWNCMHRIYQLSGWVTTPRRAMKHYMSPRLTQIDCYRSLKSQHRRYHYPCLIDVNSEKGWMCHLKQN